MVWINLDAPLTYNIFTPWRPINNILPMPIKTMHPHVVTITTLMLMIITEINYTIVISIMNHTENIYHKLASLNHIINGLCIYIYIYHIIYIYISYYIYIILYIYIYIILYVYIYIYIILYIYINNNGCIINYTEIGVIFRPCAFFAPAAKGPARCRPPQFEHPSGHMATALMWDATTKAPAMNLLIPRIVSGLVHPNYKWINPTKIPFRTGVISHLLSGMSHQVWIC